ncbi:MAG: rhomboid family intramembrane serine protease [Chitinophagaceae bacterium]|nr:rhomboid family intramembrane serine protease [Chitinophagaceae bacterium]
MEIVTWILIAVNIIVSYKGFRDHDFLDRYSFEVDKILIYKDYKRIITSGFLHVSWMHLIFNMLSLYFFSGGLESYLGVLNFLIIYFGSLVCGNLFSLFVHRNHNSYSSVGASGAVCGIIFAAIALFPGLNIGLFFIPIPAWIYGIVFVLYSIYAIRSRKENIGHEAHLGGALAGLIIAIIMEPSALLTNYVTILLIFVPSSIFVYIILTRPHLLYIDNHFYRTNRNFYSIDHSYNAQKMDVQKRVDKILEKIHQKGIKSLTQREREILDEYSRQQQ